MMLKVSKALHIVLPSERQTYGKSGTTFLPVFSKGAGIGIHADTLIGPVQLDLAADEGKRYLVYFPAEFDF